MKVTVRIVSACACLEWASFAQAAPGQPRTQPEPACQRTGSSWYPVNSADLNNAGSPGYPADPAFAADYTQSTYIGSNNVTPMGIDSTVWSIYSKVVQVTSDGGM